MDHRCAMNHLRGEMLAEDLRDLYEERAAIMEYDAWLSRVEAERRAALIVYGEMGPTTTGE